MVPRFAFVFTLLLASFLCTSHAHPFGLISGAIKGATKAATSAVNTATSTVTNVATGAIDTTKKITTTATNAVSTVTNSAIDTTKKITDKVVDVTDTVTGGAASAVTNKVSSTLEKTNKDYYTIKYALTIYVKCYRSCLMYLLDDEKRAACATERETYCKKVDNYDLKELLGVIATKTAVKGAVGSITSNIPLIG